jgi:hypothetical protein
MKNSTIEDKNILLSRELSIVNKKNKELSEKLKKSKTKANQLAAELKKNDVRTVLLTKKQEQLLLSLLKGMSIPNL